MIFDRVLMIDWSGGNDRGAAPKKDAIWTCLDGEEPIYHRNRQVAEAWITEALDRLERGGARVLVGLDTCFGYPAGFAERLVGAPDTLTLWDWFAARVEDAPEANNRFDLAGEINGLFPGIGPFWFNLLQRDIPGLPRKGTHRHGHGMPEYRRAEAQMAGAFSPWQLAGAGAVGGQSIMAFPMLSRLRQRFGDRLAVWPFEAPDRTIVLAEVFLSLLGSIVPRQEQIRDAAQVRFYADLFATVPPETMRRMLDVPPHEEGWTLGIGFEEALTAPAPPPLRNDCFALPQGAVWMPVDDALAHLRAHLTPVTRTGTLPIGAAAGRILAEPVSAVRSHPPQPNAAVDGFAFNGPVEEGVQRLTLRHGRSAAGAPFAGRVEPGQALRILTGAAMPEGADSVVLQEDVTTDGQTITFHGPLKRGANAREAGEDMRAGDTILEAGRSLDGHAVATAIAAGVSDVRVRHRLRVAVLSTGDELRAAGADAGDADIYDANRPMLLHNLSRWGFEAIDGGIAPDDRKTLAATLDRLAEGADAILTSGGASQGDEDHVSALLKDTGSFALWRVAVKPGRPLAMGMWQGVPVFGLPGNPVAAQVCALIFARPALFRLAGMEWTEPQGFTIPAGFAKSKKAGRREYLRARITDGRAEPFPSEGSGRVSGLAWATGLVELPDRACTVAPGDPVRFLPFTGFGL